MPYLNRYAFIGNLTKAPELKLKPAGEKQALCLLNVAINRTSRDERGEKIVHTTYINDVEVWGNPGEACAHYLTQGSLVLVEGRVEVDQWQDRQSGAKRTRLKVVAENVQFLHIRRPQSESSPAPFDAPAEPPADPPVRGRRRPAKAKP